MTAPLGRFWPESDDPPMWWDEAWPGMLLREVTFASDGSVASVRLRRVPLDRDLQAAMDWAAKVYS